MARQRAPKQPIARQRTPRGLTVACAAGAEEARVHVDIRRGVVRAARTDDPPNVTIPTESASALLPLPRAQRDARLRKLERLRRTRLLVQEVPGDRHESVALFDAQQAHGFPAGHRFVPLAVAVSALSIFFSCTRVVEFVYPRSMGRARVFGRRGEWCSSAITRRARVVDFSESTTEELPWPVDWSFFEVAAIGAALSAFGPLSFPPLAQRRPRLRLLGG